MEQVGGMYESGEYFVSALIMAGEIFRQAAHVLVPLMTATESPQGSRKVVVATVKGDIHDIGKNIAGTLLEARGFAVVDLGVDVDAQVIADTVVVERPPRRAAAQTPHRNQGQRLNPTPADFAAKSPYGNDCGDVAVDGSRCTISSLGGAGLQVASSRAV